jgi:hypothetical protein
MPWLYANPHHPRQTSSCPYCKQPLPADFDFDSDTDIDTTLDSASTFSSRAPNYFQLLAVANETSSRPSTPPPGTEGDARGMGRSSAFAAEAMAEGYFKAFFQEECRLGMGAYGSVFLCQVSIFSALLRIGNPPNWSFLLFIAYVRWKLPWSAALFLGAVDQTFNTEFHSPQGILL